MSDIISLDKKRLERTEKQEPASESELPINIEKKLRNRARRLAVLDKLSNHRGVH